MSLTWAADRSKEDPEFADDMDATLGPDPADWVVYRGWASSEAQKALYEHYLAGGPLAAPPGHSAHEHGVAADVARRVDGHLLWDYSNEAWARMQKLVDDSPRLHGGWKFPPVAPADPDHIQAVKWQQIKADLKREGRW